MISRIGSPGKIGVPSGAAKTSPPKRKSYSAAKQEAFRQQVEGAQIGDVVGAEAEGVKLAKKIVETAGEEEVPARRQLANKQTERRSRVHTAGAVSGKHRQFILIGEQSRGITQPLTC